MPKRKQNQTQQRQQCKPWSARDWLFRIAKNACLDHAKKTSARRRLLFRFADPQAATTKSFEAEAPFPDPRLGRLKDAVRSLPPKLKEVFVLREYGHLSYEDIGATLGLKQGTVMSRLSRARAIVAGSLQETPHGRT
jgi:RNA polymerase sigma-70 factor (ECF subfamily)